LLSRTRKPCALARLMIFAMSLFLPIAAIIALT
jgi:hypothetical protein